MVQRSIQNYTFIENLLCELSLNQKEPTVYNDLSDFVPHENYIFRIIIPSCLDLKFSIIKLLRSMNISDATLFPGIDGFTRSLKFIQEYAEHSLIGKLQSLENQRKIILHNRFKNKS